MRHESAALIGIADNDLELVVFSRSPRKNTHLGSLLFMVTTSRLGNPGFFNAQLGWAFPCCVCSRGVPVMQTGVTTHSFERHSYIIGCLDDSLVIILASLPTISIRFFSCSDNLLQFLAASQLQSLTTSNPRKLIATLDRLSSTYEFWTQLYS